LALVDLAAATTSANAKTAGTNGRIAFARFAPALQDTVIYTANSDGSNVVSLLDGAAEAPHWSPDGNFVAVLTCADPPICDTAAEIVNPDNGATRVLQMPDPALFSACVIWSPDARRLACEGNGQTDPSRNGIYTISSAGGDLVRVTSNPGGDDNPIDYSPDGGRILFARIDPTRSTDLNQALFVANLEGTEVRRITPWGFSDDDGGWSPDGTRIVFEHLGRLYIVHPDGKGLTPISLHVGNLTTSFPASDAGWSPDGARIVFSLRIRTGPRATVEGIYTASVDGSDVREVTTSPTRDDKADWGAHPLLH
jgi:TolB protein